jgi:sortase (surface protein transpeptidase)
MTRRRKILFRATLGVASVLAIQLIVLGFGAYGSTTPSSERILPAPASSAIAIPPSIQTGPTIAGGVRVNLSNASVPASVPVPTRLQIPAIGVDTSVAPLGRNPDGTAQVPSSPSYAGWYDLGPRPGQLGPAVILGHVDSLTGPGVFYRLRSLLPGDIITIRAGDQVLRFEVSRLMTYAKDQFPTAAVFGATPDAELRLITCSGPFDRSTGHYLDNIVVFAILTA